MTWRIRSDGLIEKITTHNWETYENDKLKCVSGRARADANCTGCGSIVSAITLMDVFGDGEGGLVSPEMADGIAAGLFVDCVVAATSH